jgi:molybdopterin converting factor small subunit
LYVEEEIPSRRQTLEEAQEQVVPAVYNQKVNQLMQEWTKKLRDAAEVTIYVDFGR